MPLVVDLHLLDGESIVSPYNCYFIIRIFPALITFIDHDVLLLDHRLHALSIYLKDCILLGIAGQELDG